METKRCRKCGGEKPLEEFYGNHCYCKPCHREYKRMWYQTHAERLRQEKYDSRPLTPSVVECRQREELKQKGLKLCKRCGCIKSLNDFYVNCNPTTRRTSSPYCKECHSDINHLYSLNNRDKINARANERVAENKKDPQWIANRRLSQREYMRKHRKLHKVKCLEYGRMRDDEGRKSIDNRYVKKVLRQQNFSEAEITPDIVELKRLHIQLHRTIKQRQDERN